MKKTLKELTIKDNFMFGAVMSDEDNCKRFLEMILRFPIERVEVCNEKSLVYHPEYHGVRLDVYAKDENKTHYNVEMQSIRESDLEKRARYYHSQIDMELLLSGEEYGDLPNTYVIFICDFDPFNDGKYCYTFENRCIENNSVRLKDGAITIFLNTKGKNANQVSAELVNFLEYVKADLADSTKDFQDDFVQQLQISVQNIKKNRKMEENYMLLSDMLRKERKEGKVEGKAESIIMLLEDMGVLSEELKQRIEKETDDEVLSKWLKIAAKAVSVEAFENEM